MSLGSRIAVAGSVRVLSASGSPWWSRSEASLPRRPDSPSGHPSQQRALRRDLRLRTRPQGERRRGVRRASYDRPLSPTTMREMKPMRRCRSVATSPERKTRLDRPSRDGSRHPTVEMSASCYRAVKHTLSDLVGQSTRSRSDVPRLVRCSGGRSPAVARGLSAVRLGDDRRACGGLPRRIARGHSRREARVRPRLRPRGRVQRRHSIHPLPPGEHLEGGDGIASFESRRARHPQPRSSRAAVSRSRSGRPSRHSHHGADASRPYLGPRRGLLL